MPNRVAYALAAGVIGLGLFASITPSPLYHAYSVLWHFSPLTLTLIYATYAFGVLASLLLVGGVSDDVGRRPVLLVALGGLMAATVLFMVADSAAWLFVARGIQGLSTGAALSAASAALLDLHPRRDPAGVGLTNGAAATAGIGLGILVSSSLVRIGWEPRVLPYAVLLVLAAIAFAGAYWMPEPVLERSGFRLTVQRPKVPAVVRRPFVLAALAVLSSWSIGALFFSLGPQLALHLFHSTNVIVSGIGIVALAGVGDARPAPDRTDRPLGRREHRLDRAGGRNGPDRPRFRDRLQRRLPGRVDRRRRRLRRRVPRRPTRPGRGHPARAPGRGHGRLLRRRLRIAVGPRRPRRHPRHAHLPAVDLRDLRQRRRRDRARSSPSKPGAPDRPARRAPWTTPAPAQP